jgi:hypothetical protein
MIVPPQYRFAAFDGSVDRLQPIFAARLGYLIPPRRASACSEFGPSRGGRRA